MAYPEKPSIELTPEKINMEGLTAKVAEAVRKEAVMKGELKKFADEYLGVQEAKGEEDNGSEPLAVNARSLTALCLAVNDNIQQIRVNALNAVYGGRKDYDMHGPRVLSYEEIRVAMTDEAMAERELFVQAHDFLRTNYRG